MGSFDISCAISGLNIEYGTKMKMLLLTESPCGGDRVGGFEPTSFWVPRTPPVSCIYDDYGRGIDFEEENIQNLWMKGLTVDMIEQGIGDNKYHDPATTKDMSFEAMLEAADEQRLFVDRKFKFGFQHKPNEEEEDKPNRKDGVPSFSIVAKMLREAGLTVNGGEPGVHVDEIEYDQTRVRIAEYADAKESAAKLKEIYDSHLTKFAGTVTKMRDVELRLFPHPDSDHHGMPSEREEFSAISICMVRQDIWDALLNIKTKNWWGGEEVTSKNYRDGMDVFHKEYLKQIDKISSIKTKLSEALDENKKIDLRTKLMIERMGLGEIESDVNRDFDKSNPIMYSMRKMSNSFSQFTHSLREHYEIAVKEDLVSDSMLDGISDITYISMLMMSTQWRWMPSFYAGQEPYWGESVDFHQAFVDVAKACKVAYDKDRAEYE